MVWRQGAYSLYLPSARSTAIASLSKQEETIHTTGFDLLICVRHPATSPSFFPPSTEERCISKQDLVPCRGKSIRYLLI